MAETADKQFTGSVLDLVKQTGIDIVQDGDLVFWQGEYGGQTKPQGPLAGKKMACIVGSEFSEFDAIQIPGAMCPYNIVETGTPLEFLKKVDAAGKIITYICHGGIPVAAADLIKGKKATGWQASKDSIEIMGGEYNEKWAAVVDGSQVSGRTPPEIPEYVDAIMVALLKD